MNDCLLLVDIQNDYFAGGHMELVGMDQAAANARRLLRAFRAASRPVVHIRHVSVRPGATFCLPGTQGAAINERVAPLAGETVVTKHFPNSFGDTGLQAILSDRGIDTLTICGAMSHMCIDATTRAAFDMGFQCRVAADVCATRDLVFQDRSIAAGDVHGAFMAALAAVYAEVGSSRDFFGASP
jgi:nicotinamidase-related amidase